MRLTKPRVEPLDDSDLSEEQAWLLNRHSQNGRVLNIFRTLAHHPKLLKRWTVFGNHVLNKSSLSPRDREIVILRTGWLCRSEYEWGQHVLIGKVAGLTDEEIERITQAPDMEGWTPLERLLLEATDQLVSDSFIADDTWKALSDHYDTSQLMDLVFAVGQYQLVSMALNTLGVQRDKGVPGFPS
jgi:alkylhydroperoxidase family enzyme